MIELFVVLTVALVFSIYKFGKKRVKKAVTGTVKDVKDVLGVSPIDKLKAQLKKAKVSCVELSAATEKLKLDRDKEGSRSLYALLAAKKAKEVGNRADSEECFNIHLNCKESITVLDSDIAANETLYEKVVAEMSKKEIQVSKCESRKARQEMRKTSNEFRLSVARDVALQENAFGDLEVEEICEEELEAVAYVKLAEDLGVSSDIVDKYNGPEESDAFLEFYGTKDSE